MKANDILLIHKESQTSKNTKPIWIHRVSLFDISHHLHSAYYVSLYFRPSLFLHNFVQTNCFSTIMRTTRIDRQLSIPQHNNAHGEILSDFSVAGWFDIKSSASGVDTGFYFILKYRVRKL